MIFPPPGPTFKLANAPTTNRFLVHSRSTYASGWSPTLKYPLDKGIGRAVGWYAACKHDAIDHHQRRIQPAPAIVTLLIAPQGYLSQALSVRTNAGSASSTSVRLPLLSHMRKSSMHNGGTLPPPLAPLNTISLMSTAWW
ncbi:hypothetical protein ACHAXA_007059 [Cyclostephanos tholiformis]|uniref:Uncharacterized protein n=1 Tax=Cyclostephanos tholiformis TaxID=382380 RepID=A0ABD3RCS6_9STRA